MLSTPFASYTHISYNIQTHRTWHHTKRRCLNHLLDRSGTSQLQNIVSQVVLNGARDICWGPFCLPQGKRDRESIACCSPRTRHLTLLPSSSGKPVHPHGRSSSFGYWFMAEFSVEQICSTRRLLTHLYAKSAGCQTKQVSIFPFGAPSRKCSRKS
jgi:hypothetical protein